MTARYPTPCGCRLGLFGGRFGPTSQGVSYMCTWLVFVAIPPPWSHLQFLSLQYLLAIPGPTAFCKVVHCRKFNQRRKHKGITDSHEPVHGCGIGHFRQGVSCTDAQSRHGKDSGDPCGGENREVFAEKGREMFLPSKFQLTGNLYSSSGYCATEASTLRYHRDALRTKGTDITMGHSWLKSMGLCLAQARS